ncbi:MAG: hypothetical protein ACPG6B_08840 [Oceanihabitans sp.]
MKNNNELHLIEKKYPVDKLKVNQFSAWPILRQRVYFEIFKEKFNFNSKLRTRSKVKLVQNLFYGIKHLFKLRKYDYLFFNNADKRTLEKENKKFDVFFDAWANKVGQEKSLFIEWAIDQHFPKKQTYSKNVISDLIFKSCCFVTSLFTKVSVSDAAIIQKIQEDYNFQFNLEKELKTKLAEVSFYRFLFKKVKPKAVFLISSFTKMSIVIAAHLEKIKVYEAQHGFIGENHQFYNSVYNFESLYYPDYLIGFGTTEKTKIPEDFIFSSTQILPVGSLQLEDIQLHFKDIELEKLKKKYKKIFCVTLQTVKEHELLTWVNKQAMAQPDWLFIIKPKNITLDYSKYTAITNCILLPQYNIYKVLKYSNYNITIYSTTAVEASIFNAKTLFFNIDNLSVKYFDIENMYASKIETGESLNKEHLQIEENIKKSYFVKDYYNNVDKTNLDF